MTPPEFGVRIVDFPRTPVAMVRHHGAPEREHDTAQRLVAWRIAHRLSPDRHAFYGVHHTDPRATPPDEHRVDFCVAFDGPVEPNEQGVEAGVIPASRCAVVRHLGSRDDVTAASRLVREWLPSSGEAASGLPIIFHYVNVGPGMAAEDMITDVYLPLR